MLVESVATPVKLQLSVDEAFLTTRSDDARVRIRTAVDSGGKLVAKQALIHLNTGAYAENSPMVCRKAANRIVGPYRFPNVRIDCLAIYTNTVPASSYRGLGAAQITFPVESQMDELAHKIGCEPQEFRLRNLAHSGESIHPGLRPIDADVRGDIRLADEVLRANGAMAAKHGRSVCCSASDAGAHPVTLAMVQVHSDGSISVMSGSTEIGQGSHTVLMQIAAEEMGIPLEKVRLVGSDTAVTLFERSTGASRTTTLMGRAVMEACREAIAQCKAMAEELLGASASEFVEERGGFATGKSGFRGRKSSRGISRWRAAASSDALICGAQGRSSRCPYSGKSAWWAWRLLSTKRPAKFRSILSSPWATWGWQSIRP